MKNVHWFMIVLLLGVLGVTSESVAKETSTSLFGSWFNHARKMMPIRLEKGDPNINLAKIFEVDGCKRKDADEDCNFNRTVSSKYEKIELVLPIKIAYIGDGEEISPRKREEYGWSVKMGDRSENGGLYKGRNKQTRKNEYFVVKTDGDGFYLRILDANTIQLAYEGEWFKGKWFTFKRFSGFFSGDNNDPVTTLVL